MTECMHHMSETHRQGSSAMASSAQTDISAAGLSPEAKEAKVYAVFQKISEDYDSMNNLISMGRHHAWKRALIKCVLALQPSAVLDVASGTGDIALELAGLLPEARVVASDFSENMLAVAERRRDEAKLTNVEVSCQNAMEMSFPDETFDVAVVSFGLRNMPDYARVISEMVRVLRPGGLFCCLDASYPTNWFVKPFFRLYFKFIMPAEGRFLARAPEEYKWLNESTEAFLSKKDLALLMKRCGLSEVEYRSFMLGGAALHTGYKGAAGEKPAA